MNIEEKRASIEQFATDPAYYACSIQRQARDAMDVIEDLEKRLARAKDEIKRFEGMAIIDGSRNAT